MKGREQKKCELRLHNTLKLWKRSESFEILIDISEYVTLSQLLEKHGNVSHAVKIAGNFIFD